MKKCAERGIVPVSIGIDTWAVDYVLLDERDAVIGNAYGYRDERTTGMDQSVYVAVSPEALYQKNGIQKQILNTIYQLKAHQIQSPQQMEQACSMLMIPDWLHFQLSGVKATEYTNASTTQLVSPKTLDWDWELIDQLGYPRRLF